MREYKTVQGDTWDIIARKVYGDEKLMHKLINANYFHREIVIFPASVVIKVPDVIQPKTTTLPPWKR